MSASLCRRWTSITVLSRAVRSKNEDDCLEERLEGGKMRNREPVGLVWKKSQREVMNPLNREVGNTKQQVARDPLNSAGLPG